MNVLLKKGIKNIKKKHPNNWQTKDFRISTILKFMWKTLDAQTKKDLGKYIFNNKINYSNLITYSRKGSNNHHYYYIV